jgi:hypothetical protein
MAAPHKISIEQIAGVAKGSVANVMASRTGPLTNPHILGFVPPYWWVGFVIDNLDEAHLAEAQSMATNVHGGVANAIPAAKSATAGIIFVGGHCTIGFQLPPDTAVTAE